MKHTIVLLLQLVALVVLDNQNLFVGAKHSKNTVRGPKMHKETFEEIPDSSKPQTRYVPGFGDDEESDDEEPVQEERRLQGGGGKNNNKDKNKNKNKETPSPTITPTDSPTNPPTNPPTNIPTPRPTKRPTKFPTPLPTKAPTAIPSKSPLSPTSPPTLGPTSPPTHRPTHRPTNLPTDGPTHLPTYAPTHLPTNVPTDGPTYHPTNLPTNLPTHGPTNHPTVPPTIDLTRYVEVEKLEPITINVTLGNFTQLTNRVMLEIFFKELIEAVLDTNFNQEWYPSHNKSIANVEVQYLPEEPLALQRNSAQILQAQLVIDGQVFVHANGEQESDIRPTSSFHDSFDYSMLLYFTFWGVDDVEQALENIGGLENPVINSVSIGEKQLVGVGENEISLESNVDDVAIPQLISASGAEKRGFLTFIMISASSICLSLL